MFRFYQRRSHIHKDMLCCRVRSGQYRLKLWRVNTCVFGSLALFRQFSVRECIDYRPNAFIVGRRQRLCIVKVGTMLKQMLFYPCPRNVTVSYVFVFSFARPAVLATRRVPDIRAPGLCSSLTRRANRRYYQLFLLF